MSQAEIAGGTLNPPNEFPSRGHLFRDFALKSTRGHDVQLSDYRGRVSLIVIFTDEKSGTATWLLDLASQYEQLKKQQAEILVVDWPIQRGPTPVERMQLPFPVLVDEKGELHSEMGATDNLGNASAAVYILDRFLEVFASYRSRNQQVLPTGEEILSWLDFINSQCPECEPPEWPPL